MPLAPRTRLGTYEILGPLGAGGMGEVYRARDLRLGREVAVKVLPAELASSRERLARFEREARTVAGLNHPHIVTLFSVEEERGIRFLTMELVEGRRLSDLIIPGGLPISRLLELSIPLTEALAAAHEHGVIHRDLKPGNVMVTHDGRVKVLDFGLAKVIRVESWGDAEAVTPVPLSEGGQVLGTIPYMAPEQIRGEGVDARTDLFALGIILYELASGRRPFGGATPADVLSAILRDTPKSLTHLRPDLPEDLPRIVTGCLEKAPGNRAQTALDVHAQLGRLKQALEHDAPLPALSSEVATIAVLPFVNMSHDEENEYFSDGLAEELLNVLAKIRGLKVAARSSSFHFKGRGATIAEVGETLGVATVLEGSVRKSGNRVRIAVQLVKVSDGYELWTETYDRTLEDIFAVQDDIARSVVQQLRRTLLGETATASAHKALRAEVRLAARGRGQDPKAHELYLRARHLIDRSTPKDVARAIEHLKEALALDPGFALGWAELGRAHSREADQGWTPVTEGYSRAREAAERALALEPNLAAGYARMGWIKMTYDWDWWGAEASYRRAMELAPGSAPVLLGAGILARNLGAHEEAIGFLRRALERDPLSPAIHHNLGLALHDVDRFTEAEKAYRRALELGPHRSGTHSLVSQTLLAQGRGEEALAEAEQEVEEGVRLWALAIVRHSIGERKKSDEALRALIDKHAEGSAYQVAEVRAARGESDEAFEWLERAYAQRDSGLCEVKPSSQLRSLHGDARWGAFLEKMGLED